MPVLAAGFRVQRDPAPALATIKDKEDAMIVLDHLDYTRHLLLRGAPVPWDDVAGFVSFFRQGQGLLGAEAALVDLGAYYRSVVASRPELRDAMAARTRTGHALKTLLADDAAAVGAVALASAVATTSRAPLVVQVPAPLTWLGSLAAEAGAGNLDAIESHHAENMAVYMADWLRRLSGVPVATLLLDGRRTDRSELPPDSLEQSAPVANATEHYRWGLAMRFDDGVDLVGHDRGGAVLAGEYWTGTDLDVPDADLVVTTIPAQASPEDVLSRLAAFA